MGGVVKAAGFHTDSLSLGPSGLKITQGECVCMPKPWKENGEGGMVNPPGGDFLFSLSLLREYTCPMAKL